MFWFVLACSDYNIHQKMEDESPVEPAGEEIEQGEPIMIVDPPALSISGVCPGDESTHMVSVLNTGDGDLVISNIDISASGWTIAEQDFPIIIPSNEVFSFEVLSAVGNGIMTIYSNDPNQPSLWVELSAVQDTPPIIQIQNPLEGAIIPVEGMEFTAEILDIEDDVSMLAVDWYSDVDGLIGTTPVSSTGTATLTGVLPSSGIQELTAQVIDSCANDAFDAISVCQQEGYETDSLDISTWNFEGSAVWDSNLNVVELTGPNVNQAGTAFSTVTTVNAQQVEIEFLFFVSGGSGADGFSLTALDANRMTGFVGSTGGGIGYAGMPGWSIEVDTYQNSSDPTASDHVAFTFDGNVNAPVLWSPLPEMEDGQWHSMRVEVNDPHVLVEIDGTVYIDDTVSGNLAFPAYVGFTAATGSLTNFHLIDSLTVTEQVCQE